MQPTMPPAKAPADPRKLSGIGATEDLIDVRATIPQRIDSHGTKVEDLAGTGRHDSPGG